MKLSVFFLAFSIIPTILIFLVSFFYIHSSFDQWFKHQVVNSVSDSIDLTVYYYDTTKNILSRESKLIQKHLSQNPSKKINCEKLGQRFIHTEWFTVVDQNGKIVCQWIQKGKEIPLEMITSKLFTSNSNIIRHASGEYIFDRVALPHHTNGYLGVLLPKEYSDKMAKVIYLSQDLKSLNPYGVPLKSVYMIALLAMTALLIFSSIWIGIHVADRLTKPLNKLIQTMTDVKRGIFKKIKVYRNDQPEMKLVKESYNEMIEKWEETKKKLEKALTDVKEVNIDMTIQKRFIELVLNDLDSAIVLVNSEKEFVFHNRSFKNQFINQEGITGLSGLPTDLQTVIFGFIKKTTGKRTGLTERVVKELPFEDGNRNFEILLRTLVFREGSEVLYMAILHDVTDVQQEQALMAWQEVAKRVAHEIKNPLTPIQLNSERLQRKLGKEGKVSQGDLIESLKNTLYHVNQIKDLVSEFTKVANLPSVSPALGGIPSLIEKVQDIYEPLCAQYNIRFLTDVESDISPFPYDSRAVLQVFQNLIQNSIQAMRGASLKDPCIHLKVSFNRRLQLVIFTLEDNGPGIDPAIFSKIFSPNFSTKERGMGLGLSISKKIVEDHGGRIHALSGRRSGTKFVIELPIYRNYHYSPPHFQSRMM